MIQNNSTMSNVYWGLKENWWKQIYDGEYHQFGSEVFDKGLHGRHVEPGFYNSIKNASEYAVEQMGRPLTIECYKRIHQLACEHFPYVGRNQINVDKENIDCFRNNICRCFRDLTKNPYEHGEYAYGLIFILILLSGICFPISEDIVLLISGGDC